MNLDEFADVLRYVGRSSVWHARSLRNKFVEQPEAGCPKKHELELIEAREAAKDGKPIFAIRGMERNGTNYLTARLEDCGYKLCNKFSGGRDQLSHKHCRFGYLQPEFPGYYASDCSVTPDFNTAEALNSACRFPEATVNFVIKKTKEKAVHSFLNFAIRGLRFRTKRHALANAKSVAEDYERFYAFWQQLHWASPRLIVIVDYEEVAGSGGGLKKALELVGQTPNEPRRNFTDVEVNMSPANRKQFVSLQEVKLALGCE